MTQTYLTTEELSSLIKYDPRTIRDVVVNKIWSQVKRQVYILPQLQQVLTHH